MNALSRPDLRLSPVSDRAWLASLLAKTKDFVGLPKLFETVHGTLGSPEPLRAFAVNDRDACRVGWAIYHGLEWKNRGVSIAWNAPLGMEVDLLVLLVGFAFSELNLERIEARIVKGSLAAQVLLDNGFLLEGTERCAVLRQGLWCDVQVCARLRDGC